MFQIASVTISRDAPLLQAPPTQLAEDWKLSGVLLDARIQNPFNKMSGSVANAIAESMIVTAQILPTAVSFFRSARTDSLNFNRFTLSIPSTALLIDQHFPQLVEELGEIPSFVFKHTITREKTPESDSIIVYAKWLRDIAEAGRIVAGNIQREEVPFFTLIIGVMIFGSGDRTLSLEVHHSPSVGEYRVETRVGPKTDPLNLTKADTPEQTLVALNRLLGGGPHEFYLDRIEQLGPQGDEKSKNNRMVRYIPELDWHVFQIGDISSLSTVFDDINIIFDTNHTIIDRFKLLS